MKLQEQGERRGFSIFTIITAFPQGSPVIAQLTSFHLTGPTLPIPWIHRLHPPDLPITSCPFPMLPLLSIRRIPTSASHRSSTASPSHCVCLQNPADLEDVS